MEIKWRALSDIMVIIPCSFILVVKTYICAMCAQSLQFCLSLCDPMDSTPPGSSVHGILQARILDCQWVAMPSTRVSFWPRSTINQEKGQFNSSWVAYVIKGCLQDWIRKLFFFFFNLRGFNELNLCIRQFYIGIGVQLLYIVELVSAVLKHVFKKVEAIFACKNNGKYAHTYWC